MSGRDDDDDWFVRSLREAEDDASDDRGDGDDAVDPEDRGDASGRGAPFAPRSASTASAAAATPPADGFTWGLTPRPPAIADPGDASTPARTDGAAADGPATGGEADTPTPGRAALRFAPPPVLGSSASSAAPDTGTPEAEKRTAEPPAAEPSAGVLPDGRTASGAAGIPSMQEVLDAPSPRRAAREAAAREAAAQPGGTVPTAAPADGDGSRRQPADESPISPAAGTSPTSPPRSPAVIGRGPWAPARSREDAAAPDTSPAGIEALFDSADAPSTPTPTPTPTPTSAPSANRDHAASAGPARTQSSPSRPVNRSAMTPVQRVLFIVLAAVIVIGLVLVVLLLTQQGANATTPTAAAIGRSVAGAPMYPLPA